MKKMMLPYTDPFLGVKLRLLSLQAFPSKSLSLPTVQPRVVHPGSVLMSGEVMIAIWVKSLVWLQTNLGIAPASSATDNFYGFVVCLNSTELVFSQVE
jgi:hypothetical protein